VAYLFLVRPVKTGFLYALCAFLGAIILLLLLSFVIGVVWSVRFVPERLGEIIGRIAWFLAFVAFVFGWIRQANQKAAKPPPSPPPQKAENLQPIDYSKLSQIVDDDRKANQPLQPEGK
jgi:hypothetical protein